MFHLILDDLAFNEEFNTFLSSENFTPEDGKVYQTLGIIGCQSSGKSTLMNYLFNTKFAVMDESEGQTQTTKGIWLGINKEFNTLIFDVEGTDSKERGDDRFKFEQCSSLFTLAMSDVLMINMWTSDIGRYTASNYGVLKIVFELNLKLFQQESEKKIVVVLRDYDSHQEDINILKATIMEDMRKIWEEIPKPENLKGKSCETYFKFEFVTLAHKFYQQDEFMKGIDVIKGRLKRCKDDNKTGANLDSLFNLVNYDKNVPVDGLYKYTKDMWNSILNNEDLNIPGQKEMLAMFKCEEIKTAALNLVINKINELDLLSSTRTLSDFNTRVNEIKKTALDFYDSTAKNYINHVYEKTRKKLENELANKMYSSFTNQVKRLIPKYQQDFRNEFEKMLKTNDDFCAVSEELKKKYLGIFEEEIKKVKVFDTWDSGKDNEALLDEIIDNQKKNCLEEIKEKLIEKFGDIIEDLIVDKFEYITDNFWEEFEQEIFQMISQNLLAQKIFLGDKYKLDEGEIKNFVIDCENKVQQVTKQQFLKQLPNFPDIQIENFKKDFWYDDGVPKKWNEIDMKTIDESFTNVKNKFKKTFQLFKEMKTLPHLLEFSGYEKCSPEEFDEILNKKIGEKLNEPEIQFEKLLDEQTLESFLIRYEDEVNEIYDDAKKRHNNIKSTNIPLIAWILLFYVGYKDVWKMFTGNWLILLILFMAIFAVLRMVGLGNAPFMVINMITNKIRDLMPKK